MGVSGTVEGMRRGDVLHVQYMNGEPRVGKTLSEARLVMELILLQFNVMPSGCEVQADQSFLFRASVHRGARMEVPYRLSWLGYFTSSSHLLKPSGSIVSLFIFAQ